MCGYRWQIYWKILWNSSLQPLVTGQPLSKFLILAIVLQKSVMATLIYYVELGRLLVIIRQAVDHNNESMTDTSKSFLSFWGTTIGCTIILHRGRQLPNAWSWDWKTQTTIEWIVLVSGWRASHTSVLATSRVVYTSQRVSSRKHIWHLRML